MTHLTPLWQRIRSYANTKTVPAEHAAYENLLHTFHLLSEVSFSRMCIFNHMQLTRTRLPRTFSHVCFISLPFFLQIWHSLNFAIPCFLFRRRAVSAFFRAFPRAAGGRGAASPRRSSSVARATLRPGRRRGLRALLCPPARGASPSPQPAQPPSGRHAVSRGRVPPAPRDG